ncbi:MAG: hypothetical protein JSV91_13520 [Phycisphaerales bacterium]|nr:MAG: hypothetical protein JSV91_13520 [Phycisphaerales bacterium]
MILNGVGPVLRIVTRKLYRAFPELDGFDDDQCERLLRQVKSGMSYAPVLGLALLGFGLLPFLCSIWLAVAGFQYLTDLLTDKLNRYWVDRLAFLAGLIIVLTIPSVVGLITRDVVMRFHIRRALAARLKRIQCLGCKYLLLGQRVIDGFVTCPECGIRMTLWQLELSSPEELAPPDAGEHELAEGLGTDR